MRPLVGDQGIGPREQIDMSQGIQHLPILKKDGELDEELEPDLSDEVVLELQRAMLLSRRFDERLLTLQRRVRAIASAEPPYQVEVSEELKRYQQDVADVMAQQAER